MFSRRQALGVAAVAPVAGIGPERPADVPAASAPPPSGGDDTALLLAALPPAGPLLLRAGTYQLSGRLVVGDGQDVLGLGGNLLGAATVVRCTSPTAGVTVTGSGGVSGNLQVDGAGVASMPFARQLGQEGAQRTFINLSVVASAEDNIVILGAQNDAWLGCNSQRAARDGLVLDQGAGGHAFVRCEIDAAGRHHLRCDAQVPGGPYAVPTDNTFDHCIFERGPAAGSPVSTVHLAAHDVCVFSSCTFQAPAAATGARVDVAAPGSVTISGGRLIGDDARSGGTGLRVVDGAQVVLANQPQFLGLAAGIDLVSGDPSVTVIGSVFWNNVATRFTGRGEPSTAVRSRSTNPWQIALPAASGPAVAVGVEGEAGVRLLLGADGSVGFNDGQGFTPQAVLRAGADGVLSMPEGQVVQTGRGPSAVRPAAPAVGAGSAFYDTSLGKPIWSDGVVWRDASGAPV